MGIPQNDDTIEQKVSNILSKVLVEKEGKKLLDWNRLDTDISDELKFAVTAEKRRRDTQASYTKISQKYQLTKAEADRLREELPKSLSKLTHAQLEELEELKYENPDEWYNKLNEYKQQAEQQANQKVSEIVHKAKEEATQTYIAQTREEKLAEFNKLHPNQPLTDEHLAYDIPIRVKNQLENGDITFEEALAKIHKIVYGGVTVKNPETIQQPSLNEVGSNKGGVSTSNNKKEKIFF